MYLIDDYNFGKIIINGKSFSNDLIILPEKVLPNWWRKEGHFLQLEDLEKVIEFKPDILIIGTGANGVMKVPKSLIDQLNKLGIETFVLKTENAVKEYNKLINEKHKVAAGLHLTC